MDYLPKRKTGEGNIMAVCISCGHSNVEHARFCQACGTAIPVGATPAGQAPPTVAAPALQYGGFWIRFVAYLIDWIFVGVISGVIAGVSLGPGIVAFLVVPWLYEALMLSNEPRATLGKMALGMVVTDVHGERLTFGRATGRHFAKYLSAFIFCIGFIMAAFTARKQALHDMIADTLVMRA